MIDCTHHDQLQEVVRRLDVGTIYHLAALLSAIAEQKPHVAWDLNMSGLYGVLEVARRYECKVFFPSSIGAFGPSTPRDNTPQVTVQRPTTMYGLTKVAGELLCDYYFQRFGVDTRGLRLPGIVSFVAPPGGGTTDYAVDIFYQAIRYQHYTCFLRADTRLDMMYMPDMLRAVTELMEADSAELENRNAFNVTGMNVTPEEVAAEIRKHIPSFVIDYDPDPVRQAIADSWPRSVDDAAARSMYGLTKVAGELLCDYYFQRFGVDTRGLRLPGIVSFVAPPGGGTTDYAVDIFYQAIRYQHYTCFLRADTRLDMMYMPDMLRAVTELMEADSAELENRNAFNVTGMNVTPEEVAAEIRKHIPSFVIDYDPDPVRQAIADSWPRSVDDAAARAEWNWQPQYDLASMTTDMLEKLRQKLRAAR